VPEPAATESPEARLGTAERMRASIEAISAQAGADATDVGPRADSGPLSLGLSQSSLSFPPLPPPAAAAAGAGLCCRLVLPGRLREAYRGGMRATLAQALGRMMVTSARRQAW
jgi:hypothetical protein